MNPDDLWSPFESVAENYNELVQCINDVCDKAQQKNSQFAWRGQTDASWGLFSSLYRRLRWTKGTPITEEDLFSSESNILKEVHQWGLHMSPTVGRMSVLNQLATLQHYGAPTRLIDVTFNPWIAAWFCIENPDTDSNNRDARLFAISVTNSSINENDEFRRWEDCLHRPWPVPTEQFDSTQNRRGYTPTEEDKKRNQADFKRWTASVYSWKPPHINSRIAAQNGAFIFGGVPADNNHSLRAPKGPGEKDNKWSMKELRECTSIARRPHKLRGSSAKNPTYSIRIKASAKNDIRERLEKSFGYKHSTIYPDYTGFATFGKPKLRSSPPPS